jgi:putative endonuclease
MDRGGYVYILMNKNNTVLYIGVTADLAGRISQHKAMKEEGFTKRFMVDKLVYYEYFDHIEEAIDREKKLKGSSRSRKLKLVSKRNPAFVDLFKEINLW